MRKRCKAEVTEVVEVLAWNWNSRFCSSETGEWLVAISQGPNYEGTLGSGCIQRGPTESAARWLCRGSGSTGLTWAATRPGHNGLRDGLRGTSRRNGAGRGKLPGCPGWRRRSQITLHRGARGSRPPGLQGIKPNPDGNSARRDSFYLTRPEGLSQMRAKRWLAQL